MTRLCLKCDREFPSHGPENRLCRRCINASANLVFTAESILVKDPCGRQMTKKRSAQGPELRYGTR